MSSNKNNTIKSQKKKRHTNLPIGINDPFGLNINPLTNKPYQNLYQDEIKTIKGDLLPATYPNLAEFGLVY